MKENANNIIIKMAQIAVIPCIGIIFYMINKNKIFLVICLGLYLILLVMLLIKEYYNSKS